THLRAKGLVGGIARAKRVAVQEESRGAVEVDLRRIGDELHSGGAREAFGHEEIAVAMHEAHRDTRGALPQCLRGAGGERKPQAVVAHPVLEEVAEDEERVGVRCGRGEQALELLDDRGTRIVEVQVRDEERAPRYLTHSAFSITTGCVGTFWWPPELPVGTFL